MKVDPNVIEQMYLQAKLGDYDIRIGPEGPYIHYWDEVKLGPRPSDQQLQDARLPALKEIKKRELSEAFAATCRRDLGGEFGFEILGDVLTDNAKRQTLSTHLARLKTLKRQADGAGNEADLLKVLW